MIKHLFCRTNADPVPHQNHYFRHCLVLPVKLILSNNLLFQNNNNKMVVLEIGFVQSVQKIIFLAEQIVLVAKLLNKKLSNKIIETKVQIRTIVVVLIQIGIVLGKYN